VSRLAREVWARSDPQNSDPGRDAEFQCQCDNEDVGAYRSETELTTGRCQ
jgi:hypothetical protein